MSKSLNKIGKRARNAFKGRLNTKIKNKVLEDYYKLINKNKNKLITLSKK
jgi:glutamate-5-semialdehyde dehydrogenase